MPPTYEPGTESVSALKLLGIRACGTCVKAKVKCVPTLDGGKCQRCKRLDKLCQAATSLSRKKLSAIHVSKLEEKLDRLVTLFAASKSHGEVQHISSDSPRSAPVIQTSISQVQTDPDLVPDVLLENSQHLKHTSNADPNFCLGLQPNEAANLVLEYRTQMAPQFPFVVIPPDETPESLRLGRPMLWGAIVTAASYHDPSQQEALGWKMMEQFSTRLLVRAEKTLDLLQGLLVHLSWYHYHSSVNPQFMNLLSLAKSLVMNLGYHRTRNVKERSRFLVDGPDGLCAPCLSSDPPLDVRKFEEWRALAGCFFLAAMYVPAQEYREFLNSKRLLNETFRTASSCRRADPLPFTKNLEEGCKALSERQEYPGDRLISCLVAIQSVVIKSNAIFNEPDTGLGRTTAPIWMHINALKSELQNVIGNIPLDLRQDPKIICCSQIAEISLHEYSVYNSLNIGNDKANRLNDLYACLLAVKSYFDTHLAKTSRVHPSHAYSQWIHSSYALIMAIKLCACKAEGWDFHHAREMLKCSEVIEILLSKMEAVVLLRNERTGCIASFEGLGTAKDVFARYLRHARCVKNWFEPLTSTSIEESQNALMQPRGSSDLTPSTIQGLRPEDADQSISDLPMAMDDSLWQVFYDENTDWMMMGI